jgi:geranylgeranyl diphosphate synthase type I
VWGEARAINAGDALFTLAYCALESLTDSDLRADTIVEAWRIFNATTLELTRGQHLDMHFEGQPSVTTDAYLSMISGKSAALVAGSAQIGALIGAQDVEVAAHIADFGLNLGIAFQIRDDILGIWGDPNVTGKSAATDILSRKKSLPVLHALGRSQALVDIYQREPFGAADVPDAIRELDIVGAYDYAQEREAFYYQQALAALKRADLRGTPAQGLLELTEWLFRRDY